MNNCYLSNSQLVTRVVTILRSSVETAIYVYLSRTKINLYLIDTMGRLITGLSDIVSRRG